MNREHCLKDKPCSGLSKQQKQIMESVRANGYNTTFDTTNSLTCHFNCNCDFDKPNAFRRYMASLNVCASRSLARLVERGLVVKIKSRWVGYSDVFVDPNNTDKPPDIKRRTHSEELALNLPVYLERLSSKLTVTKSEGRTT
jgi:hypothetical protein